MISICCFVSSMLLFIRQVTTGRRIELYGKRFSWFFSFVLRGGICYGVIYSQQIWSMAFFLYIAVSNSLRFVRQEPKGKQ